jgi:hypothetical protein
MSEQYKTSSDNIQNLEHTNVSDSLWDLKKDLETQYNTSPELLEKVQNLIRQNTSIELADLKSTIEQSDFNEQEKQSFSEIPDISLQNFMNEVLKYREIVTVQLDSLNNDVRQSEQNNDILSSCNIPTWISKARYIRALNPTKPHHHLDGCIVWLRQTINTSIRFTWELIVDTIKLPRDISRALFSDEYTIKDYQA